MASIESRLAALTDALERRKLEQGAPIDGLSRSLFNLERELAALDEQGKRELLEEMNCTDEYGGGLGLTPEDIDRWIKEATQ